MWTIVGLGNPGKEYEHTRHNIAWLVLRSSVNAFSLPSFHESKSHSAFISEGSINGKDVRIVLPTTFMNNSGGAVKKALAGTLAHLVVLHDDIDLPFGVVKVGVGRGAGGHNGVKSIIQSLGSMDFIRVRIGIGKKNIFGIMHRPKGDALSNFVLGELTTKEEKGLPDVEKKVCEALKLILERGVETAMQEVNSK
jgi:peptidyl-tRNA hydrolase, PTH1 family